MAIEFKTGNYEWEHGRSPKGRGFWGFTFEGYEFWQQGTFAEAKKACKAYIKELAPADYVGTVFVEVLT